MSTRRATCSCGQLAVEVTGDPTRISVCHCLACQQRTGSAFGAQARFAAANTRIEGRSTAWTRVGDSGGSTTFHFCPTCGATVHYGSASSPELIAIPLGAFADPSFPAPTVSIYDDRRHPWASIAGDVEHIH